MPDRASWAFIAWAPYGRRSETLARELDARMYFIHNLRFQEPFYAPLKYLIQTVRTARTLVRTRPRVVFVQNPPFICGLVVYSYCRFFGAHYVLDHHSDAFSRRWQWALPIQKFLARHAVTNLVTNVHWLESVRSWPAEAFILEDALPEFSDVAVRTLSCGYNIVFINTFADDEPLDAVLAAAAQLSSVNVYITGNKSRKPIEYYADLAPNIVFTDFLPDREYFGLLTAADAVMALTSRDYTLQGGGFEAVALGKPLITSDWPYLRRLFAKGTVYVDNSPAGIRDGIVRMQAAQEAMKKEMSAYAIEKRNEWRLRLHELLAMLR